MQREHTKGPRPKSLAERFWPKVDKDGDCWLWTGSFGTAGYGQISIGGFNGYPLGTHRVAWELTYGPIPRGLHVCHRCDVKACCRPDHLFLGTRDDNMRDMDAKGRGAKGTRLPQTKLTEADVRAIRRAWDAGQGSQSEIAQRFGVNRANIGCIVRRETWKHVD